MFSKVWDSLTWRGKSLVVVTVLVTMVGAGVLIGMRSGTPTTGGTAGGGQAPTATAVAVPTAEGMASAPPGNSTAVGSSTGVDLGADLPRLEGSQFAQTSDPAVFAASVRAAMGYDYSSHQPTDLAAEADRINQEILAGMTPSDGPLGPGIHDVFRSAVTRSTNIDQLAYRVEAHQRDQIDVTEVSVLDNETLHEAVGSDAYAAIISARSAGIYQYSVTASVTTTVEAVGDTAGWTRTLTTELYVLVHCPAGGWCTLTGIAGSEQV